ncbi:hypothetical protein [Agrobacterium radiobacter]|uniref:hypothetical protein n=1 Tax=Agrobacterium radiobacter TaxID=362 RepID=UPI003F87A9DC
MTTEISERHWSEQKLQELGVAITPALVQDSLQDYWDSQFEKRQVKKYLQFDSIPNGWREGVLIGCFKDYSGVKNIHFSPSNERNNLPLRHIDILLRRKSTGERLLSLEGKAISFGRTAWFAPACIDLLLNAKDKIEIFLFGAGELGREIVRALNENISSRIKKIWILSRGTSNERLVRELADTVKIPLAAVWETSALSGADLVIIATSSPPAFNPGDLAPKAVTLSLSMDDVPQRYLESLIEAKASIICDDMLAMEERNVNALALLFSRKGQKLSEVGPSVGVKHYSAIRADKSLFDAISARGGPAHFTTVGLASMDIAVAAHIYEKMIALPN